MLSLPRSRAKRSAPCVPCSVHTSAKMKPPPKRPPTCVPGSRTGSSSRSVETGDAAGVSRTIPGITHSSSWCSMQPQVFQNALEMIARTPLLAVRRLDTGPCELFLKLENQNPGGSIKDRVGLYLIEAAEKSGKLKPGGTLMEATGGNTALALSLVAGQKGYRLLLVIPDKMSQEKIFHLRAMGAEVVM